MLVKQLVGAVGACGWMGGRGACSARYSARKGEARMPRTAEYRLTWQAERGTYELHNSQGERLLTLNVEDSAWFEDAIPCFGSSALCVLC
jgi:hypothetical protein